MRDAGRRFRRGGGRCRVCGIRPRARCRDRRRLPCGRRGSRWARDDASETPAEARMTSAISGSSHGCVGGPLRLCQANPRRRGAPRSRRFVELRDIRAGFRHGERDAVRGEDEARGGAPFGRDGVERARTRSAMASMKPGWLRTGAACQYRAARTVGFARAVDIFEILAATGIRAESGGDEGERAPDAIARHLADGIGQHRMPVAVAPIDGQGRCAASSTSAAIRSRLCR